MTLLQIVRKSGSVSDGLASIGINSYAWIADIDLWAKVVALLTAVFLLRQIWLTNKKLELEIREKEIEVSDLEEEHGKE